ncbi:MAG: HAD family hydrolase [Thermoplasmata archaeon]
MTSAPAAITLDLWHTLVYLTPQDEEAYMLSQMDLATTVLEQAAELPGASLRPRAELHKIFQAVYGEAVAASQRGESVPPPEQLVRAAERGGRVAETEVYLEGLRRLVAATPFKLGPGALETLREIRSRGWRTAVISNTVGEPGATLRPTLRAMGFDDLVEEWVFSDEHPWTKPSPQIFHEALGRLGVAPQRAVHVGDGWPDIEGPRRAGMRGAVLYTGLQTYGAQYQALFLPPGWESPKAEYQIHRLEALPGIAERLFDGRGRK